MLFGDYIIYILVIIITSMKGSLKYELFKPKKNK